MRLVVTPFEPRPITISMIDAALVARSDAGIDGRVPRELRRALRAYDTDDRVRETYDAFVTRRAELIAEASELVQSSRRLLGIPDGMTLDDVDITDVITVADSADKAAAWSYLQSATAMSLALAKFETAPIQILMTEEVAQ